MSNLVGRGMICRLYSQSQTSRKISACCNGNSVLLKHPIPPTNTIISTSTTRGYVRSKSTSKATATTTTSSTTDAVGKIFFPSLCLLTFGLGSWQTKRYFEKVDMVKKREDDLELDPLSSFSDWQLLQKNNSKDTDTTTDAKSKSYRRVNLQGKYQHDKQILIGPRGPPPGALAESGPNSGRSGGGMSSSTQGYWVITPLVIITDDKNGSKSSTANTTKTKREWLGRLVKRTTNRSIKRKEYTTKPAPQEETIVWVNRGWIPRHYINKSNQIVTSWDEPNDIVQLVAMESNTETPGTYSPPSRLDTTNQSVNDIDNSPSVDKLLWMDRTAMEEITCTPSDVHPPLFVEINTDDKEETVQQQFPVKPTREFVGEFKIPPSVHVGYAITWYGLSGAGMIMTRKLLTKGR